MPYLQVLSEFREGVRKIARERKGEAGWQRARECLCLARCCGPGCLTPGIVDSWDLFLSVVGPSRAL